MDANSPYTSRKEDYLGKARQLVFNLKKNDELRRVVETLYNPSLDASRVESLVDALINMMVLQAIGLLQNITL